MQICAPPPSSPKVTKVKDKYLYAIEVLILGINLGKCS